MVWHSRKVAEGGDVPDDASPDDTLTPDGLLSSRIPALDGDARVFDSLVVLALDLCFPPPLDKRNTFTDGPCSTLAFH